MEENEDPLAAELVQGINEAAEIIVREWTKSRETLLRLDGFMGAGKSRIAAKIAEATGTTIIGTDDFAKEDGPAETYAAKLEIDTLRESALQAISSGHKVIFEGVCLQETLPTAQFTKGFCVYLKRVSVPVPGHPLWHDGYDIGAKEAAEDPLHEDILRYHREEEPHLTSNINIAVPEGID